jgi:glycolate oxidase iron-sulfur subunit
VVNADVAGLAGCETQLARCIRCGTCRSVCPVFHETGDESTTARGKLRMVDAVVRGQLELTPGMQERMSRCLLCKACTSGCPSGVRTDEVFVAARTALAGENPLPFAKRAAFTGLTYRRTFELGLRLGAAFQGLAFRRADDGPGLVPRIPLPSAGLHARRVIPPLSTRPLRVRLRRLAPLAKRRARVAFYPGCMLSWVYPEAGEAVVRALRANGVDVVVPERLSCCGTPAFTNGDAAVGAELGARNVAALGAEPFDAIVTGCASCGSALRHDYAHVLRDEPLERWRALSRNVLDFTELLTRLGTTAPLAQVPMRVTYHDPCHLVRGMGVSKEPRELLRAIPGLELREMKDAARCCGGGGTFSLSHYELSRKIGDAKVAAARDTDATTVVTGCSGCRMQIADGLAQRGVRMSVAHTAELLARAYAGGEGEARGG